MASLTLIKFSPGSRFMFICSHFIANQLGDLSMEELEPQETPGSTSTRLPPTQLRTDESLWHGPGMSPAHRGNPSRIPPGTTFIGTQKHSTSLTRDDNTTKKMNSSNNGVFPGDKRHGDKRLYLGFISLDVGTLICDQYMSFIVRGGSPQEQRTPCPVYSP
jgi:hypothetical protein